MPKKKSRYNKEFWDRRKYPKHKSRRPKRYATTKYRNYNDPIYKKWRKEVYKRDGYACQWPGCKHVGSRVYAHHILRWTDYPMKRFEVSNGITLCKNHHDKIKGEEEIYANMFLGILLNKLRKRNE